MSLLVHCPYRVVALTPYATNNESGLSRLYLCILGIHIHIYIHCCYNIYVCYNTFICNNNNKNEAINLRVGRNGRGFRQGSREGLEGGKVIISIKNIQIG